MHWQPSPSGMLSFFDPVFAKPTPRYDPICTFSVNPASWAVAYSVPAHLISDIDDHIDLRGPDLKLPLPRGQRRQGHHDHEGAVQLVLMEEVGEERDGLDGLP